MNDKKVKIRLFEAKKALNNIDELIKRLDYYDTVQYRMNRNIIFEYLTQKYPKGETND